MSAERVKWKRGRASITCRGAPLAWAASSSAGVIDGADWSPAVVQAGAPSVASASRRATALQSMLRGQALAIVQRQLVGELAVAARVAQHHPAGAAGQRLSQGQELGLPRGEVAE